MIRQDLLACLVLYPLICLGNSCTSKDARPPQRDEDKFSDHIRTTGFQTPEEERAGFILPDGFEITLYASEPDISKPMNMEFDDRGRLWVTQSSEYPLAAHPGNGKDRLSILEDTNGDGKADKFIHFEDTLNIPIGVLPMTDGAVAYSIPSVYYFKDTNHDDKAESRNTLLTGFGYKDTHGMVNNFIRGFDGWINACHGFSNSSGIAGSDGDSLHMSSGNTFRFRPDGSHVEQTSRGRVNPFGFAYDERGYLYSVDCHSKPIYQIITGGDYPGFGKKAPGIGYAPEMMSYELGSTALSGLEYYTGEQFPEEYRNNFYVGDVVTCEVNRNSITYKGSTPISKREADFIVSRDPWFRPVAITMGPDGAMYVADFYNRIIGHYEVALDHPARDRSSGRIWKITYTGNKAKKAAQVIDWSKASLDELIKGLDHPHLNVRLKIADRLEDVWKEKAVGPLLSVIHAQGISKNAYTHALWVLGRLNALSDHDLDKALTHTDPLIRVHALRILTEKNKISAAQFSTLEKTLSDNDPHVRRASAAAMGKFTDIGNVKKLLDLYLATDSADTHLRYTALLSIRNNLKENNIINKVLADEWDSNRQALLLKVLQDVPSPAGAAFMLHYLGKNNIPHDQMIAALEYTGRYLPRQQLPEAIALIRKKFANDMETQFVLYGTMRQGIAQSGLKPSEEMKQWGISMSKQYLNNLTETSDLWTSRPLYKEPDYNDPWESREDFFYPMVPKYRVIYSERGGYLPTGIMISRAFKLPPLLKMNLFDYDIHNTDSRVGISKNVIRIRLKSNDQVIGEYRLNQKTPSKIEDVVKVDYPFDLERWQGQEGYIEVVDSSTSSSVGIGNLQPQVVPVPVEAPSHLADQRTRAVEIAGEFRAVSMVPELKNLVTAKWMNDKVRIGAAGALMTISPHEYIELIGNAFNERSANDPLRKGLAAVLGQTNSPKALHLLEQGLKGSSPVIQVAIAKVLAGSSAGIDTLLAAIRQKSATGEILNEAAVQEAFNAHATASQIKAFAQLAGGDAQVRAERDEIIKTRLAAFQKSSAIPEEGKTIFVQNCSMCHSLKNQGGMIGPQLDGIGNWGAQALAQKILDPNRNISEAFRTYTIKLKNGKTVSGLYRRTEGEVTVYADPGGREFSVAKTDIAENKASKYTLMPDQFRNSIAEKDFSALLKYLTSLK